MKANIVYKAHDTHPPLEATLKWHDGSAIDLSQAAEVVFTMNDAVRRTPIIHRRPVTIVNAANGLVRVDWQAGDLQIPGEYDAEFEITFQNGRVLTVPNTGYIRIQVVPDLG